MKLIYAVLLLFVALAPKLVNATSFEGDILTPTKEVCDKFIEEGVKQREPDLSRPYADSLFVSQLDTVARCLYKRGRSKLAIEFWLLASSYGSTSGGELGGVFLIVHAENALQMHSGVALLRQTAERSAQVMNRYHVLRALALLQGKFEKRNRKLALKNLVDAWKAGSAQATYLLAYFIEKGIYKKSEKLSSAYWKKEGDKLSGNIGYDHFIDNALLSDVYGPLLKGIRNGQDD
ncbi:hypothetical protein [Pseudoalteromonas sp. OOF1S-7]|uniref:hypothetical protein n=1 Tax=Pseudoalteromonas sp. OOF1S-7 TaxID=2917757 RepID=UPI001EF5B319|nr:hypothetical protein [Pseudoalteromonas sp. OOF1S-7]MCG7537637.1 hypothetical protein [Pseudoalteromonas sp. OOF1S-7]